MILEEVGSWYVYYLFIYICDDCCIFFLSSFLGVICLFLLGKRFINSPGFSCSMAEEMHYTKYEKARLIGARSLQISMGAPIMLDLSKEELEKLQYNPIRIAMLEFSKGVIPIEVKRNMPKHLSESVL